MALPKALEAKIAELTLEAEQALEDLVVFRSENAELLGLHREKIQQYESAREKVNSLIKSYLQRSNDILKTQVGGITAYKSMRAYYDPDVIMACPLGKRLLSYPGVIKELNRDVLNKLKQTEPEFAEALSNALKEKVHSVKAVGLPRADEV